MYTKGQEICGAEREKEMTEEVTIHGFKLVEKAPENLEIGEGTYPARGGKFRGVSVGRSKLGYCAFTHRADSRTFNTPKDIPEETVTFIRSTG